MGRIVPAVLLAAGAAVAAVVVAPAASADVSPAALSGYTRVHSAPILIGAHSQVAGVVNCPRGTYVLGGGGGSVSDSPLMSLNGSIPGGTRSWRVYMNNNSDSSDYFTVSAECAAGVVNYKQRSGTTVTVANGEQNTATVSCPRGSVVLGGGGYSTSTSPRADLNDSVPRSTGWRIDVNNQSGADTGALAVAVCGQAPDGYQQVSARRSVVRAHSDVAASASCPAGTSVFSGGLYVVSPDPDINMRNTGDSGPTSWTTVENNNSDIDSTLTAWAVCGQTN